ncbi:MAG: hypothetical protein R3E12_10700 [Candidatus Eisenbacteria bacterium]
MATPAHAAPAILGAWSSGHVFGGGIQTDSDLTHYDWDARTHPAYGGELALGWRYVGIGARYVSGENEQRTENPLVSYAATVRSRTVEAIVPVRVLRLWGFGLTGCGSLGRMWLTYDPDRVEIPVAGSDPLIVELSPIETWTVSAGGAIRHGLAGPLDVGLSARRRWFELDTAHRVGEDIAYEKQSFGQWEVQIEVGWEVGL